MSKRHGAREQKRLQKQKAKRAARRREVARRTSDNPYIRLQDAFSWPVVEALVPEGLWELGIGNLVIARRTPQGEIAFAIFLVDVFSLGVKNALWNVVSTAEYDAAIERIEERESLQSVAPEHFAKLLYRAVDYAQALGIGPHRDFPHARLLLEGIDPSACREEFQFGQGGEPLYVRGPHESLEDARIIAERIRAAGGDFIVPLDPLEVFDFGVVDADEDDEEGPALDR